jgi:all-trans-retinol 13,14-reductase
MALKNSSPYINLYMGFKGDITEGGAGPHNQWVFRTWDMKDGCWDIMNPDEEPNVLYISFPSQKNPDFDKGPDCKNMGEVVTFVKWEHFEKWEDTSWHKRGKDYNEFKESIA